MFSSLGIRWYQWIPLMHSFQARSSSLWNKKPYFIRSIRNSLETTVLKGRIATQSFRCDLQAKHKASYRVVYKKIYTYDLGKHVVLWNLMWILHLKSNTTRWVHIVETAIKLHCP